MVPTTASVKDNTRGGHPPVSVVLNVSVATGNPRGTLTLPCTHVNTKGGGGAVVKGDDVVALVVGSVVGLVVSRVG
jgi:hypothetical protein